MTNIDEVVRILKSYGHSRSYINNCVINVLLEDAKQRLYEASITASKARKTKILPSIDKIINMISKVQRKGGMQYAGFRKV